MENQQSQERKPLSYQDFNLRFASYQEADGVGTFKVWVEGEAPGGTMKPDAAEEVKYDSNNFKDLIDDLDRRDAGTEDLFKLGGMLSNLALPIGPVRELFERSLDSIEKETGKGLRIRLRIDPPALKHLPWELMLLSRVSGEPQEKDFLALQPKVSIVRTDTSELKKQELTSCEHVKIVGMLSSPSDQKTLSLKQEQEVIEKAIKQINESEVAEQNLIQIVWAEKPATRESLQNALSQEADVFHYAGHGQFNSSTGGSLILETLSNGKTVSDEYDANKLAQLLQSRDRGVRLVVLGACKTGRRDGQSTWSGVASTLSREKFPAVIANQFTIRDDNAIKLAFSIYSLALLGGFTIDEAISDAREIIYQKSGLTQRDWATPVTYLQDASGVLFPLSEADTSNKGKGLRAKLVANFDRVIGGTATGVDITNAKSGEIEAEANFKEVKDASVIGVKIENFGK